MAHLVNLANYAEREIEREGRMRRYREIYWESYRIWGATAAIMGQFRGKDRIASVKRILPDSWRTLPGLVDLLTSLLQTEAKTRFVGGFVRDSLLGHRQHRCRLRDPTYAGCRDEAH